MGITIKVGEYWIREPSTYTISLTSGTNVKNFPLLIIDKDSYISEIEIITAFLCYDEQLYNFQIGKYTSIASGIKALVDINHDYKSVFQGRISYFHYGPPVNINRKGQIIIQNDCWIGMNVTILGGVTIHNGAVVAACSVVTKDVPPYAIVAGNPAQIIGYRFTPKQIDALLKISWWDWDDEKIQSNKDSLNSNVDEFINEHIDSSNADWDAIPKIKIPRIAPNIPSYLFFVDFDSEFSLFEKVVSEFLTSFPSREAELILYVDEASSTEVLDKLNNEIKKYSNYNSAINIISGFSFDERILFNSVDFYITNRSFKNVQRMCIADLLNVKCISSVDSNIFK